MYLLFALAQVLAVLVLHCHARLDALAEALHKVQASLVKLIKRHDFAEARPFLDSGLEIRQLLFSVYAWVSSRDDFRDPHTGRDPYAYLLRRE